MCSSSWMDFVFLINFLFTDEVGLLLISDYCFMSMFVCSLGETILSNKSEVPHEWLAGLLCIFFLF